MKSSILLIACLALAFCASAQQEEKVSFFLVSQTQKWDEASMKQVRPGVLINLHVSEYDRFVIKNDNLRKENIIKLMGTVQEGHVVTIINKDNGRVFVAGNVVESLEAIQLIYMFGKWHPAEADHENEGWVIARSNN